MDPNSGKLTFAETEQQMKLLKKMGLIEVKRNLTAKETYDKQIRLYSPCGCGSGKKFKFCCKTEKNK
jgi:uncharacterized protein YchJ